MARYLFRRVVSWGRSSNVFLRNGARLYLDVGSHPEYATPECDSVPDLVVHDRAGERILEGLLVDAEKRLHDEGIAGEIYLFKNNTDSAGNSYGCHENYLVSRHGEFGRLADVLIPFLVTRQLICGAGKVLQTPRGAVYCLSQRAEHIWEGVSSATTRSRPIINTRDEPHADAERYRRLHVIVGDSNMNEVTDAAQGRQRRHRAADDRGRRTDARPHPGEPDPGHPRGQPRRHRPPQGHASPTARSAARWTSSRSTSAKAAEFVERRGSDAATKRVLELWGRVLNAVESGDLSSVDREIDWVTKLRLIERYQSKHDLPLSHPRVAQMDLAYHDLRRGRGLYALLEKRGAVDRVANDMEIFQAKETPPQTTRARLRGEFIQHAQETPARLHRRLGPPQAQRPGAAHRAVQGPVPRL